MKTQFEQKQKRLEVYHQAIEAAVTEFEARCSPDARGGQKTPSEACRRAMHALLVDIGVVETWDPQSRVSAAFEDARLKRGPAHKSREG